MQFCQQMLMKSVFTYENIIDALADSAVRRDLLVNAAFCGKRPPSYPGNNLSVVC